MGKEGREDFLFQVLDEHGPAHFPPEAAHLPHAHGPQDLQELVVPGPHEIDLALRAPLDGEFIDLHRAGAVLGALAAEAALQGQQQGQVNDDGVRAADNGLGHVLRQGDAAAHQEGDRIPELVFHQTQVAAADQVLQVLILAVPQAPGLLGGVDMDDLRAGRGQFRHPGHHLAVSGDFDADDQFGIALFQRFHLFQDLRVVQNFQGPHLGEQGVVQV